MQRNDVILSRLLDLYNHKLREDELCGTITANGNLSSTHCGTFAVVVVEESKSNEKKGDGNE